MQRICRTTSLLCQLFSSSLKKLLSLCNHLVELILRTSSVFFLSFLQYFPDSLFLKGICWSSNTAVYFPVTFSVLVSNNYFRKLLSRNMYGVNGKYFMMKCFYISLSNFSVWVRDYLISVLSLQNAHSQPVLYTATKLSNH